MDLLQHKFWKRKDLLSLLLIWLIVQTCLLFTYGIKTDGEGLRVISEANKWIASGKFSSPLFNMYLTEISLVILKLKLNIGFGFIIAIHLILNLIALLVLYKFLISLYTSNKIALAGCLLLAICFPYQSYNTFIYTESIFFSLSIIYSCYLLTIKKYTGYKILVQLILLVALCLTRPSGIFFIAATIIYLYFYLLKDLKPVTRAMLFTFLSIIALTILNFAIGLGGGIDILLPFKDERIICDVPTLDYEVNIKTQGNGNSLYGLGYYVTHNFSQFSRLALLKSQAFFGLTRPYYSTFHNFFLQFFFYSLYVLTLISMILFKSKTPFAYIYIISLALIYWISVVLSCDEWHNRFFLTLTPFFITSALYLFTKTKKDHALK
ncbi:MAG: hypothetical protein ABIO79_06340 [Ferruginibacter sp.]